MGEEWEQNPRPAGGPPDPNVQPGANSQPDPYPFNQEDIDKRIEDIKRMVIQGASEAQVRFKRVVDKANIYWQQTQTTSATHQPSSIEEHRIRQLVNIWSNENWRVTRDLGNYMEIVSWGSDEVWEVTLQTRWETRSMEVVTEPYAGRSVSLSRPLLPVWDYELPAVVGLKPPQTRTRLEQMDEVVACTNCNSTGHVLCSTCTGRGWIVCPDCKGRTKRRCTTCRGRGYVADWASSVQKKPFLRRQADNVVSSVGGKVADMFDNIRQQGVPIPNPVDTDPAVKGPTVPCPDCINGEVECTCGTGKRVCNACQGAKMSLCSACGGTGKLVRHREVVRLFDLKTQVRFIGDIVIPAQSLARASGELIYSAEVNETLYPEVPPDRVPLDVWRTTFDMVSAEGQIVEQSGVDPQTSSRPTLQVIELVRIPYTKLQYRYADQDYVLYIYDGEGQEKFYADRYPARWDRIERLVKAISTDLMAPMQRENLPNPYNGGSYRVPVEMPPYTITEEDEEDWPPKPGDTQNKAE